MNSARKYLKWFDRMIWVYLAVFFIGVLLPERFDRGMVTIIEIMKTIVVVCLGISVLTYYEYLLKRKKLHKYRVEWQYFNKSGKPVLNGGMSFQSTRTCTSSRELLEGQNIHKELQAYKKYLDNGTIKIKNVVYTGYEYEY